MGSDVPIATRGRRSLSPRTTRGVDSVTTTQPRHLRVCLLIKRESRGAGPSRSEKEMQRKTTGVQDSYECGPKQNCKFT